MKENVSGCFFSEHSGIMEKSISVDCLALNDKKAQRNIRQNVRNREFVQTGAKNSSMTKNQLVSRSTFRESIQ